MARGRRCFCAAVAGRARRGRAWCEEVGLWRQWARAWDESLAYARGKVAARRIATGTPKRNMPARELVRRLLDDPAVVNRQLRTIDNRHNLSVSFWQRVSV